MPTRAPRSSERPAPVRDAGRRVVLQTGLVLGVARCLGAAEILAQDAPAASRPEAGDRLVASADASRTPLTPDDIRAGDGPVRAWAMEPLTGTLRSGSRLNQILLLRLDPGALAPQTRSRSADGILAYTSICPHNGCDVDTWLAPERLLACPCHDSTFDPKDAGKIVDGPAPRALPALPLRVADGKLVVAAPFTAPIGFEKG